LEGEARTAAAATVLTALHGEVPKEMPAGHGKFSRQRK
jgi:hypothetical protein